MDQGCEQNFVKAGGSFLMAWAVFFWSQQKLLVKLESFFKGVACKTSRNAICLCVHQIEIPLSMYRTQCRQTLKNSLQPHPANNSVMHILRICNNRHSQATTSATCRTLCCIEVKRDVSCYQENFFNFLAFQFMSRIYLTSKFSFRSVYQINQSLAFLLVTFKLVEMNRLVKGSIFIQDILSQCHQF